VSKSLIKHRGRPAAGPGGEKRSEMRRQIAARVPDATYAQLRALTAVLDTSQAEVLARALGALEATLSPPQRNALRLLTHERRRR